MTRTLIEFARPTHLAASFEPLAEVKAAKRDPTDERLFAELRTVGGPAQIETTPEFRKAMKEVLGLNY